MIGSQDQRFVFKYSCTKFSTYLIKNKKFLIKIFIFQDVALLFDKLHRTSIGMFKVPFDSFNHVDFMWGKDAPTLVYTKLLELMARFL